MASLCGSKVRPAPITTVAVRTAEIVAITANLTPSANS